VVTRRPAVQRRVVTRRPAVQRRVVTRRPAVQRRVVTRRPVVQRRVVRQPVVQRRVVQQRVVRQPVQRRVVVRQPVVQQRRVVTRRPIVQRRVVVRQPIIRQRRVVVRPRVYSNYGYGYYGGYNPYGYGYSSYNPYGYGYGSYGYGNTLANVLSAIIPRVLSLNFNQYPQPGGCQIYNPTTGVMATVACGSAFSQVTTPGNWVLYRPQDNPGIMHGYVIDPSTGQPARDLIYDTNTGRLLQTLPG
jgi:hypothetical protein